ncbi:MAG: hypothetical protein JWO63_319 [Frankiales bacterium]|nr:hypothetical protein [Frankiales bacterium]
MAANDGRDGDYAGPPNSSYDPFAQPAQGFPPPYAQSPSVQPPYAQPYPPYPPYAQPYPMVSPPHPYASYPQPTTRNGLAIASLVCSVLGLCCGIGALAGIGLGIAGLNQAREIGSGRGLSIAGIIVGALGVLVAVGWLIVLIVGFNN